VIELFDSIKLVNNKLLDVEFSFLYHCFYIKRKNCQIQMNGWQFMNKPEEEIII